MKEYTTTCIIILASVFLIWWVQPSKAQYGARPIAPINCKGPRCPGGEVTDPTDDEDVQAAPTEGGKPEGTTAAVPPANAPEAAETPAPAEAPAPEAPADDATTAAPADPPAAER